MFGVEKNSTGTIPFYKPFLGNETTHKILLT